MFNCDGGKVDEGIEVVFGRKCENRRTRSTALVLLRMSRRL